MLYTHRKPSLAQKVRGCCWSFFSSRPVLYLTALGIGLVTFASVFWAGNSTITWARGFQGLEALSITHWTNIAFGAAGTLLGFINFGLAVYKIETSWTKKDKTEDKFSHLEKENKHSKKRIKTLEKRVELLKINEKQQTATTRLLLNMFDVLFPKTARGDAKANAIADMRIELDQTKSLPQPDDSDWDLAESKDEKEKPRNATIAPIPKSTIQIRANGTHDAKYPAGTFDAGSPAVANAVELDSLGDLSRPLLKTS